MPSWSEYKTIVRERGALAMELFIVESKLAVSPDEMMKHLPDHLAYQKEMEAMGKLVLAGPLSDISGTEMSGGGMIIYRAGSLDDARILAENDPMHKTGSRSFSIRSWLVNEGSLSFTINLSEQRAKIL